MSNVETLSVPASNSSSRQERFEPLTADETRKMNAYWRACNYLSAGMLYLFANPLLREPLKPEHQPRRVGRPAAAALDREDEAVAVGAVARTRALRPSRGEHLEDAMEPGHGGILSGIPRHGDTGESSGRRRARGGPHR